MRRAGLPGHAAYEPGAERPLPAAYVQLWAITSEWESNALLGRPMAILRAARDVPGQSRCGAPAVIPGEKVGAVGWRGPLGAGLLNRLAPGVAAGAGNTPGAEY